MFNPR